ncbi:MAG: Ig-like domain-containing protein [Rhodothermales bacterium]
MSVRTASFLGLTAFLLASCAVPVPPGGGPPDATPPSIIVTEPANGTVRVEGREIRLTFSEAVDQGSFARAWSLTPDIPGTADVSWRGRTVTLRFPEAFRPETTYILTIDSAFRDARGVGLTSPISMAFATGDRLNEGTLSGQALDPVTGKPVAGLDVFAYAPDDSLGVHPPLYRTQTGRDGRFGFRNLREGDYALLGVGDANRNRRLDPGERVAVAGARTVTADSVSVPPDWDFLPVRYDPVAPDVARVTAVSTRDLEVRFTEAVQLHRTPGVALVDSLDRPMRGAGTPGALAGAAWYIPPGDVQPMPARPDERLATISTRSAAVWRIRVDTLLAGNWRLRLEDRSGSANGAAVKPAIADSAGNALASGSWPFTVRGSEPPADTARVVRVLPDSMLIFPRDALRMLFSAPVPDPLRIALEDTSGTGLSTVTASGMAARRETDSTGSFTPAHVLEVDRGVLPPTGPFRVVVADTSFIRALAGVDATGEIVGTLDSEVPVVVEFPGIDTLHVDAGLTRFRLSQVPGGTRYRIRAFQDVDGDGRWSAGTLRPWSPPEPIIWADGTEPVRARWESVRTDTLRFLTPAAENRP